MKARTVCLIGKDSCVGNILALHVAEQNSIPGTTYSFASNAGCDTKKQGRKTLYIGL